MKLKPNLMKEDESNLLDLQAMGVVQLSLSWNVNFNIAKEKTITFVTKDLSRIYAKLLTSNIVHLMRWLFTIQMTEDASIVQYINELNIFTIQLSLVIIKFENEARALILLSLLPNS